MFTDKFESKMVKRAKNEHSRNELAILWCIKYLNELTDVGIVKGSPPYTVTSIGERVLEGFEPTDTEVEFAITFLRNNGVIEASKQ